MGNKLLLIDVKNTYYSFTNFIHSLVKAKKNERGKKGTVEKKIHTNIFTKSQK